jgi:hypothetical protein
MQSVHAGHREIEPEEHLDVSSIDRGQACCVSSRAFGGMRLPFEFIGLKPNRNVVLIKLLVILNTLYYEKRQAQNHRQNQKNNE